MKRRAEYLVEKRDGRREWLRATKLARSIHFALLGAGVDEDWRALELATTVLAGLRRRHEIAAARGAGGAGPAAGPGTVPQQVGILTTAELADLVQHVLLATGFPRAAAAYCTVAQERGRRRRAMERLRAERAGILTSLEAGAGGGTRGIPSPRVD